MGTNYYARIIPTKERKKELCKLINNSNDWNSILNEVHNTFDYFKMDGNTPVGGKIHLGKRSGGWKFLWNPNMYIIHNGHYSEKIEIDSGHYRYNWIEEPDTYYFVYPLSKEGIWNFINKPNIEVYDEHGEKQDKEKFFKMAVNWNTWRGKVALDGKSYEEYQKSQGNYTQALSSSDNYVSALIKNGFKVEWPYTDFYSDGLRFASFNEFS